MPPRLFSRYQFCTQLADANGALYLSERDPFRYQPFSDNIEHKVTEGETLQSIASRYYAVMAKPDFDPDTLWWVIADFQPDPIFDPTIALAPGTTIVVPSLATLREQIFNEVRQQ